MIPRTTLFVAMALAAAAPADDKDKEKPKTPPEKSEVAYDSKTHGAIQVKGGTGDWFTITRGGKSAGPAVPPKLGGTAEVEPGDYEVHVNKTKRTVTVKAGTKVVLETGTLVVEGKGADWWAPFEGKERRVTDAPPTLGTAVALFPGKYTVRAHVGTQDAVLADGVKVEPGQKTTLNYKK